MIGWVEGRLIGLRRSGGACGDVRRYCAEKRRVISVRADWMSSALRRGSDFRSHPRDISGGNQTVGVGTRG